MLFWLLLNSNASSDTEYRVPSGLRAAPGMAAGHGRDVFGLAIHGSPDSLIEERWQVVSAETSNGTRSKQMRRLFFTALVEQLGVVWPILSGVVTVMLGCGVAIWRIEDWRIDEALYFTFVTGLTIGYGDFTPKHPSARLLALVIGFSGIILTGLVAAVTVKALNATDHDSAE